MAVPSVIASTKESATRASVTPRLRSSAPVLASVITALSTSGGGGSLALPISRDPIHQVTTNTATDNRRMLVSLPEWGDRTCPGQALAPARRDLDRRSSPARDREYARLLLLPQQIGAECLRGIGRDRRAAWRYPRRRSGIELCPTRRLRMPEAPLPSG